MGSQARVYHTNQIHYLRKDLTFANTGVQTVGVLPAGAIVVSAGVVSRRHGTPARRMFWTLARLAMATGSQRTFRSARLAISSGTNWPRRTTCTARLK